MKLKINAEVDGKEIIESLCKELAGSGNIAPPPSNEEWKPQVFSEKAGKFIDFDPTKIKFIFNR